MLRNAPSPLSTPRFQCDHATSDTARKTGSVLVALDGDPTAELALPFAKSLARRWSAPLRLVHVRNPVEDAQNMDVHLIDNQDSLSVQTRSSAYLKELAESLKRSSGLPVSWRTVTGHSVVDTLRAMCETGAGALVLMRRKRSMLSRFCWGSVTDRLVGRLPIPLLIIPERMNELPGAARASADGFDRVLAYVDGSDAADKVVQSAIGVASANAVCHLLRVLPLASLYPTGRRGFPEGLEIRNQAWLELFKAREELEEHDIACTPRLIFDGKTAGSAIIDQARSLKAGLIIVATRPSLLPRWLRDGVAEYVVGNASVPVLVIPAKGEFNFAARGNHVDFHSN